MIGNFSIFTQQLSIAVLQPSVNEALGSLEQVCNDSLNGDVAVSLSEEDGFQSFGGKLSERWQREQQPSKPYPVRWRDRGLRDAIFLKHQVSLILKKLNLLWLS